MKIKIISIGILLCIIAGCGIFKSEKFHPHSLDGLYSFTYETHVAVPDSLLPFPPDECTWPTYDGKGCFVQKWWTNYMFVDYPYFHVCAARGQGLPFKPKSMLKEDIKVDQIKANYYKIKKINGSIIDNKNVTYIITKDSYYYKSDITHYLYIRKLKNGKKHFGYQFTNYSNSSFDKEYQKCLSGAKDTTGIFPSTQKHAVNPK